MKEDRFPLLLAFWQKTYLRVSRDWWGIGWNGSASTVILAHCSFCLYLIRWGVSSSLWDVWDVIAWIFLLWINSFDSEWFPREARARRLGWTMQVCLSYFILAILVRNDILDNRAQRAPIYEGNSSILGRIMGQLNNRHTPLCSKKVIEKIL